MSTGAVLAHTYDLPLVAFSAMISILAAYTALDLAERVRTAAGWLRPVWLASGVMIMGTGICVMHYVSMPSFGLRISVLYDWPTVLLSLVAVSVASGVALFAAARSSSDLWPTSAGSICMGAGIAATNYFGIAAMRFPGFVVFSPWSVLLSAALASGISFLAFVLVFARDLTGTPWAGRRLAGAMILGLAAPTAHYAWMAGTTFHGVPGPGLNLSHAVSFSQVGLTAVVLVSLAILALLCTLSRIDRHMALNARKFLQSQMQLRTVFDNLAEGIAVLDLEGNILLSNDTTARIAGFSSAESMRGKIVELTDAFTPAGDPVPIEERPAWRALKGQFARNHELWLQTKNTRTRTFVEISTAPIPGPDGKTAQIIVSYRDVTERKRADDARARLAAIVESSEDAIISLDLHGTVTSWNLGAEKLFGYSAQEITGHSITRLIPIEREGEEDTILERIQRGEMVDHYETVRQRKDGALIDVSLTISPVRNAKGAIVGVSKIVRNITESRRQQDALNESQQRLTSMIESAMDAIISIDEEQRVVLFNVAAERMFLCSQKSALGQPIDQFIPARFHMLHRQHVRKFGQTGSTGRAMGELGMLWALRSNGEEFPIEASISHVELHGRRLFTVILRDVTERRRAEEALREQAQLLNASQIIARDMDDHIVFWPEGAQRMYGFSEQEAIGAVSHDLFHTRFPEPIEKIREELLRSGRWEGELVHRKRDGSTVFVSTAWILHYDSQGSPSRVLESLIDVTERRRADEKLLAQGRQLAQQAEELALSRQSLEEKTLMLQSVLDGMSEGLVAADERGRFIIWNPAAERIIGRGPSGVPMEQWNEHYGVFLPDGVTPLPQDKNPLLLAIAGQPNSAVIFVRNSNTLSGAFLEISASPLRDKHGTLRGGVAAFRDVTERKAAEEKALQSEEKFAKAFRSSPIGMSISTIDGGRYIDVNHALVKMLGYEEHEIVGRTSTELNIWSTPHQREEVLERMRQSGISTGSKFRSGPSPERRGIVNISMENIWVNGEECLLTTAFDVTETRSLEQQLRQSQKMEALGQLTGGIAHDFNNLLGVIVGNLDLLERRVAEDEAALKRVQAAQRASIRGAELTRRLLAFSRREQLNPAPIAVETAIAEMVELAARTIGPEIKVSTRCDKDLPRIFVDAAALESALLNLAVNARDAMPRGGSLMLSAQLTDMSSSHALAQASELKPGKYVRIAVSDTGEGMSRETLERAFEPFFTTKPRDKGTGLGLAMVYGFIKQSGGAIRLYSEEGIGTTVSLYLPLADECAEEPEPVTPMQTNEKIGGTALLVDDEPDLLDIADAFLVELGYAVIRAADSASALEALENAGEVDLMVTDIIMPGKMNGIELAHKVRELRPGIKIIYTSGFPAEALAERSGKLEGGPLLHKPYQRTEFADMVRKSVNSSL